MKDLAKKPELLFVYGHLRRGDCAEHLVEGLPFEGEVRTAAEYRMLACSGGEFPGLIEDEQAAGEGIVGELRRVSDESRWAAMDEYEDVASGTYARELIRLSDGREVQAYLYTAKDRDELPDAGDDWKICPLRKGNLQS